MAWDEYTKLMLHMDGADESTTFTDEIGKTVTVAGDSKLRTGWGKFGSGCVKFDGSDDYLSIAAHASDWDFAADSFTIDFWFKPTAAAKQSIFCGNTDQWLGINFHMNGTRNIAIWVSSNGTSWDMINADGGGNGIGSASLSLNIWHHVALVRNGNNWRTYIDGTKDLDITVSGTVINRTTEAKVIGRWGAVGDRMFNSGYIDEFRISKGVARWTANFTPPTSAYSTDANTQLLIHFDAASGSTTFTDEVGHTVTGNGSVYIESVAPKFGTASGYLDGNGDYLSLADTDDLDFGTGDFTIDFWFNAVVEQSNYPAIISTQGGWSAGAFAIRYDNTGQNHKVTFHDQALGDPFLISTTLYNLFTWNHVALVRNGTTLYLFVNGVLEDSDTIAAGRTFDLCYGGTARIGYSTWDGTYYTGFIDEFRISKGIARWTEAFTPPTEAYSEGAVVELLVSTSAASSVGYTTATLNGNLTQLGTGDTSVTVSFEYGLTAAYGSTAVASESPLTEEGTFHTDITGLSEGQTYHFRAKAVGSGDPVYGEDATFSTAGYSTPGMSTVTPSDIGQSTATLVGNIADTGGINCTRRGFRYGTDPTLAVYDEVYEDGDFGSAVYSLNTKGLWAGTLYYVKSFAVNTEGTGYGLALEFTTLAGYPFNEADPSDDDTFIYNECDISGDGIDEQDVSDATYQQTQGPRVLSRNDSLIAKNSDAVNQAWIAVDRYKDSKMRVDSILILPASSPADLWPQVLGREISDRITLQLNSTRNPANLNQEYHIEGEEHEWDAESDVWETHWQLWDVNQYRTFVANKEGYIEHFGSVYATIQADSVGTNKYDSRSEGYLLVGQKLPLLAYYSIQRGYIEFDLSAIAAGTTILSATLVLTLKNEQESTVPEVDRYNIAGFDLTVVSGDSVDSPLDVSDYGVIGGHVTSFGTVSIAAGKTNQLAFIELNATGLAAVNAGGITRFGLRSSKDIAATAPSGTFEPTYENIQIDGVNGYCPPQLILRMA